jgi:hypothetical protein
MQTTIPHNRPCFDSCIPRAIHRPEAVRNPARLCHLVYTSSATYVWGERELLALLKKSRANNARDGITGLLLYRDGNIMQLLEGPEQALETTMARIRSSTRHAGIVKLMHEPIERRSFSESSLSFRNLNDAEIRNYPGYSEFLNQDWYGSPMSVTPDRALKLLETFRRGMR